ncbi:DUF2786 domain-containing protein [Nocardia sp. NPDC004722]
MTEPTGTPSHNILDKVRKLLAKAESVAGTPEADALNAKAFGLIAKYGIDEAQARQQTAQGPAPIETAEFRLVGQYRTQQAALLGVLAHALHCVPIKHRPGGEPHVRLYGVAGHLTRVKVLFATLMPQMLAGAHWVSSYGGTPAATRKVRASWMLGFYAGIGTRLTAAETTAAEDSEPGTALVLVDDKQRAEATVRAELRGKLRTARSRATHSADAVSLGAAAARRVDLGQTGIGGRRALGS